MQFKRAFYFPKCGWKYHCHTFILVTCEQVISKSNSAIIYFYKATTVQQLNVHSSLLSVCFGALPLTGIQMFTGKRWADQTWHCWERYEILTWDVQDYLRYQYWRALFQKLDLLVYIFIYLLCCKVYAVTAEFVWSTSNVQWSLVRS